MPYQTITPMLEKWFGKSLTKLPRELRAIATFHIPRWADLSAGERRNKAEEIDRQRATKFRIKFDRMQRQMEQAKKDPKWVAGEIIGWNDHTMNARTWFDMPDVKPEDAAKVLCRIDPLKNEDPERIYVDGDESSPERYRSVLAIFEAEARGSPTNRTLLQWLCVAVRSGLKYHSWIDEYALAMHSDNYDIEMPSSPMVGKEGGANKRPLLQQQFQEQEILRVLTEAGLDPKALRKPAAGKPGAKADARGRLKLTPLVFDKAWERLRQSGEIKVRIPRQTGQSGVAA